MSNITNLSKPSRSRDVILGIVFLISICYIVAIPLVRPNHYYILLGILSAVTGAVASAIFVYTHDSDESISNAIKNGTISITLLVILQFLFAPTQIMGFIPFINATNFAPTFSREYLKDIGLPIFLLFCAEALSLLFSWIISRESSLGGVNKEIFDAVIPTILFGFWGYVALLLIQYLFGIWIGIIVTYISGLMLVALVNISKLSSEIN